MIKNKTAKALMIQGTASSSGKSLLTSALCRIFNQDGYRVAPFKAQNMSNNSFVTCDGLEMGRAQVVQALAAGLEPDIRMNPVLLKPTSDKCSQIVLRGKAAFTMDTQHWHETRKRLRNTIKDCYTSLANEYEIIVIEGAGSPAEINLKQNDIVNMGMAEMADAPVIIVGDIDRGGVFASLVGTMHLLDDNEKPRVKGFIINKFRGKAELLNPGLKQLEEITGVPVLGVVPWLNHSIDEEDGVSDRFTHDNTSKSDIDICIINLPHISNYTDFIPLEYVPDVKVRWCNSAKKIGKPDIIIIPGTKSTIYDLRVLKKSGIAKVIIDYMMNNGIVLGVCGGFQMLGKEIEDYENTESTCLKESGLSLLDMVTLFQSSKYTSQVRFELNISNGPLEELNGKTASGYEIHMGKSHFEQGTLPFTYSIDSDKRKTVSGIIDMSGRVMGTYVHGFFDSPGIASAFINALRKRNNFSPLEVPVFERSMVLNRDINKMANVVRNAVDIEKIYAVAGLTHADL